MEISLALVMGGVKASLTVVNRCSLCAISRERTARCRVTDGQADRLDMASELRKAIVSLRC